MRTDGTTWLYQIRRYVRTNVVKSTGVAGMASSTGMMNDHGDVEVEIP